MVTGPDGAHDYTSQKQIIADGIGQRINVRWTILHEKQTESLKTHFRKVNWREEFDIVLYNTCHAWESDTQFIDSLAAVHAEGLPAIVLHCTMHSFHREVQADNDDEKTWIKLLGVRSQTHGPRAPITVTKTLDHAVTAHLDNPWTTPAGELYNILSVAKTATVLAKGDNGHVAKPEVCIWVNQYGEGKIFGTTIGHHNVTVASDEYLDLIANAITWATESTSE